VASIQAEGEWGQDVEPGRRCGDGEHWWQYRSGAGQRGGSALADRCREPCAWPIWMICLKCEANFVPPCGSANPDKCEHCARVYKARLAKRIADRVLIAPANSVGCLTWTPPGIKRQCRTHRNCEADGPRCEAYATVVTEEEKAAWHSTLTKRRNRVMTAIKRGEASLRVNGRLVPIPDLISIGCKETQKRGVLHGHDVLARSGGGALMLSETKLRKLLIDNGFGRKFTWKPVTGEKIGRYLTKTLAKYVSKSVTERGSIMMLAKAPVEAGRSIGAICASERIFRRENPSEPAAGSLVPWTGRLWTASRGWNPGGTAEGGPLVVFDSEELCEESEPEDPNGSAEGLDEEAKAVALIMAAFPGSWDGP
jgi:hypothetical protein